MSFCEVEGFCSKVPSEPVSGYLLGSETKCRYRLVVIVV